MKTKIGKLVKSASVESDSISAIERSSTPLAPLEILVLPALGRCHGHWIEAIEGAPAAMEAMQDLECSQQLALPLSFSLSSFFPFEH